MHRALLVRWVTVIVLVGAAIGCARPVLHKSGGTTFPARPKGCQLAVVATLPGPEYVEIAQITIEGDRSFGAGSYRDPQEFANRVRDEVCAAGGDTLITEVNGFGIIARGIVLRRVPAPAAATPAAAPAAPKPARAAATPTSAITCEPICSPGFLCTAGACIPQCNPRCGDNETCGNDRLCHANVTK